MDKPNKYNNKNTPAKIDPSYFGKSAPQAKELEEAVLGALLVDKNVITVLVDILQEESFYDERHKVVYRAMLRLFEKGNPIDLLTVSQELRQMGSLETIGGAFYLTELANRVASAANVEYHSRIVLQKFLQRELIQLGTEVINDAFDETGDVFELLERTEQTLFKIAERNVSRGVVSLGVLLESVKEQIKNAANQKTGLSGVPTGFTALDRLTNGWQKSDLIIVAARPAMGKTAFTLALGTFASIDCEMPVAFFSLEMSSVQLATRIVSMRANIPSEVLRTGRLSPDELLRLDAAHQAMHKMPLFIDDTAGISILELRAKCRRLKLQHDIKLVIIDYLQLMKGDSESSKSGNREQEIASISRGLKALAKELSIPVIALAQLSRAVETRGGNKRPMLSDLRECVTGDTRVLLKNGSLARIADLVGSQPEVWALDNASHRLSARASDLVWKVGEKPVFKIRLASGRLIRATAEHRLLGANGWQTVGQLKPGDRLAILRKSPEPENPVFVAPERLIVLAHLIGDGSYLTGKPLRYTTASESHSDAVKVAAEQGFGVLVNRHEGRGNWHQLVFSGNGNRWHKKGINAWLNELGIWGQRSHQKQIPNLIFQLNNEQLSLFLRHLWATDGTIFTPKVGSKKSGSKIAFSTNSRTLAEDVAMLLLRFEIVARIRTVKQGEKYRDMFSVEVSGGKDQLQFLDKIGAFGSKVEKADLLKSYLANRSQNTNVDTLPNEIFERVKSLMQAQKISQRQMASLRGTSYGGGSHFQFAPSRDLVKNYAELLQADDLAAFAENDIFWDKVLSIEADGCEEVYDLTVLEHHNWVANGIISHNSGAIEQDADIVSFLYRPEYYGLTEDDDGQPVQGIAEVIVAKHRNGAVETVRLRWDAQFAKFSNLADSEFGDIDPTEYFQVSNTNPLVAPPTNMDFPTLEDEGLKFKSQPNNDIPF